MSSQRQPASPQRDPEGLRLPVALGAIGLLTVVALGALFVLREPTREPRSGPVNRSARQTRMPTTNANGVADWTSPSPRNPRHASLLALGATPAPSKPNASPGELAVTWLTPDFLSAPLDPDDPAYTLVENEDEPTGMALYPDNVKPLRLGFVVPESYELPQGYMRHHQVSEEGTLLSPVLAYHPDFEPTDADGKAIGVPEDRIVPEEALPPGMPKDRLTAPGSDDEGGLGE